MEVYPELIVMLTENDRTVKNAYEIFERCKDSKAEYWGFKEKGISPSEMKELFAYMKSLGKTTVLEVVAYTEDKCLEGAQMAAECGCDILMGTVYSEKINRICNENNIKYIPFIGDVYGRPSILEGSADDMIAQAESYRENGVFGADLLGYRYKGNCDELNRQVVSSTELNICIAGSVDSFEKLDEIKKLGCWAFTVGGAFFADKFGGSIKEQINKVYDYVRK